MLGDSGVLVLGGPTASGKTELAIALARRYGAEIVGADSRQIYRDMPIGTAAPSAGQRACVVHHLVGFLDPDVRYSAAEFAGDAIAAIVDIHDRGKRAIVVGGTGFYLRALCGDVTLAAEPDPGLRARVRNEARVHPVDVLHDWLASRDPRRAAAISPRDPYRVVRALEIALSDALPEKARGLASPLVTGSPRTAALLPATLRAANIPFVKVALRVEMTGLEPRIARRTEAMLAGGLLDEAERIGTGAIAADAVGYREAQAYLRGWLTDGELRTMLTRNTRRYAKRQMTWFRGEPDITWIDPHDNAALEAVAKALGWLP